MVLKDDPGLRLFYFRNLSFCKEHAAHEIYVEYVIRLEVLEIFFELGWCEITLRVTVGGGYRLTIVAGSCALVEKECLLWLWKETSNEVLECNLILNDLPYIELFFVAFAQPHDGFLASSSLNTTA